MLALQLRLHTFSRVALLFLILPTAILSQYWHDTSCSEQDTLAECQQTTGCAWCPDYEHYDGRLGLCGMYDPCTKMIQSTLGLINCTNHNITLSNPEETCAEYEKEGYAEVMVMNLVMGVGTTFFMTCWCRESKDEYYTKGKFAGWMFVAFVWTCVFVSVMLLKFKLYVWSARIVSIPIIIVFIVCVVGCLVVAPLCCIFHCLRWLLCDVCKSRSKYTQV